MRDAARTFSQPADGVRIPRRQEAVEQFKAYGGGSTLGMYRSLKAQRGFSAKTKRKASSKRAAPDLPGLDHHRQKV